MDFDLTPEQQQIRGVAREFARAELGDKIAPFDERHEFPHEIVTKLGPLGFLGALVGEEFGGGIIPPDDIAALKALGVKELFGPGTSTQDIVRFVHDHVRAAV